MIRGGWTNYGDSARKWHFAEDLTGDAVSLCGKWRRNIFARGPLNVEGDADAPVSADDCVSCRRKLDAKKAKEAA